MADLPGAGVEVARLAGSYYYCCPRHSVPPSASPSSVCAEKLRELLQHYVCGGAGRGVKHNTTTTCSGCKTAERCSCAYWPPSALQLLSPQRERPMPAQQQHSSLVTTCPSCLCYFLPNAIVSGSARTLSPSSVSLSSTSSLSSSLCGLSGLVGRRRRLPMAPVGEQELLSRLVERYDNDGIVDNGRTSACSSYNHGRFEHNNLISDNTAKTESNTANNKTNTCSRLAAVVADTANSSSAVRAGSEKPGAMFSPLLNITAARARSTGPVLERRNALYESNYDSVENGGSGITWSSAAMDPVPPPRANTAAIRQLELAIKGMEQMWRPDHRSAVEGRLKKEAACRLQNDEDREWQQQQQRVQYDSITVLPASMGLPPPPPPLPRTRSFRQMGGAPVKAGCGDARASSAPPVSPLVYRKAGHSNRWVVVMMGGVAA